MINEIDVEYEEIKPKEKVCTKCKDKLNIKYFYKAKNRKDGIENTCSICINEANRKRYREDKAFREQRKKSTRDYLKKLKNG